MPDVLSFWGKAAKGPDSQIVAHPVACHLLDVAAVADAILVARPADLRREFVIFSPPADENPGAGWLSGPFKRTSFVYENAGVLWQGIRKLHSNPEIAVPGGVRAIVEDAYGPGSIPD